MKTLYLLRHAKAERSPAFRDFDRPLDATGSASAAALAAAFHARRVKPDLVLCSAARRARETFDLIRAGLSPSTPVAIEERLYMASAEGIMRRLREVADTVASLMVIGHNPGLQELGLLLGGGRSDALAARRLITRMPTAALAVLSGELAGWRDLGPGTLILERLIRPKDLQQR